MEGKERATYLLMAALTRYAELLLLADMNEKHHTHARRSNADNTAVSIYSAKQRKYKKKG